MFILARYFAVRFTIAIIGVFALCLALIFFIDFVELLREAGKRAEVSAAAMAWVALLRMPSFAELTLPFAVLIGSISAFMSLTRTSELTVVRAAGISVWQFLRPAILVAFVLGLVSTMLYNPLAASAKKMADAIVAELFGEEKSLLSDDRAAWLRQDGADGPSIIHARAVADRGLTLGGVTVLQFDRSRKFLERVEAKTAHLHDGYWLLSEAHVSSQSAINSTYDKYIISTYLTVDQVIGSISSARSVSFWELPQFIEFADKAGLSTIRYKLQYHLLLVRPFLLVTMVLLAATCSLKAFRFGRIQTMVIAGLSAGFGFFIFAELSRKIGVSGIASPAVAAWVPVVVACLLAATILLYQEDG